MAVHYLGPRRYLRKGLLLAYVFWPVPVQTPRRFDAATRGLLFHLWCRMRGHGLIRVRYYGPTDG